MARKLGGAKHVFVNNVQWSDLFFFFLNLKVYLSSKFANAQSFSMFLLSIFINGSKGSQ
jgi:hypothetical protein